MSLSDSFVDEVILHDSNIGHKNTLPWWQYIPKSDWVIRKSDLIGVE